MKNNIEIIEILSTYDFHDIPIESIEFKGSSETGLVLNMLKYNEEIKDYYKLRIEFVEIQKLESTPIELTKDSDMELFSFKYEFKDNFECELCVLMGSSERSLTVKLCCESIQIIV